MANADGSVHIDTKIDTKGFNEGIKLAGLTAAFAFAGVIGGIRSGISRVLLHFRTLIRTIMATALAALVLLGITLFKQLNDALATTSLFRDKMTELNDSFAALRGAVLGAFANLLVALLPTIITVVNWLIQMVNLAAQWIAALTGQATYMTAVAGSMGSAADQAKQIEEHNKKAKKEAQGQLAAFDELNVLQKKNLAGETPFTPTQPGANGTLQLEQKPVEQSIKDTADKIRKWFADTWQSISDGAARTVNWITTAWANIKAFFGMIWEWISTKAVEAWNWIQTTWGTASSWIMDNVITPWWNAFTGFWGLVGTLVWDAWLLHTTIWMGFWKWFDQTVIQPLAVGWASFWNGAVSVVIGILKTIYDIWLPFATWIWQHVHQPILDGFKKAFTGAATDMRTAFGDVTSFFRGVINGLLQILNGLLRNLAWGINGLINGLNTFGGTIPGWIPIPAVPAIQVPYLATGAVIPPNASFLAMLGDQRNGNNIEAPEGLLRKIVREELAGSGDATIHNVLKLDGEVIYDNQRKVSRRRGMSFLVGDNG